MITKETNIKSTANTKKSVWETVLRIIIAVAGAIVGALGGQALG